MRFLGHETVSIENRVRVNDALVYRDVEMGYAVRINYCVAERY